MTDAEECWDIPETIPAAVPAAQNAMNELLPEEKAWVAELEEAAKNAGLTVSSKFMLASWAIQAKGDMKKALRRISNYQKVEAKYRLSEISEADATAWAKQTFPTLYYGAGENKSGLFVYGARGVERDISKMKTEEDWRYLMKNMHMNLQASCNTLASVRKGMAIIINLKGISLMGYSRDFEKKTSELTTDCYPAKVKEIYMLNPPSFIGVLLGFAKMIFSSKALGRIKTMPTEELSNHIQQSQLPADLGGNCCEEWFTQREQRLAQYSRSVLEMAGLQG